MTGGPLRIAVLDDHPVVAEGLLGALVRHGADVESAGSATTWAGFVSDVLDAGGDPDVVLVDIHLNDGTRHDDVIAALTAIGIRCLVFTSDPRPLLIQQALRAGARGLILKSETLEVVIETIDQLREQDFVASSELAYCIVNDSEMVPHLAPRELDTMTLISTGLPRKSVGPRLPPKKDGGSVTEHSVNEWVGRVGQKYREAGEPTSSTIELLNLLRRHGYLIDEPH